MAQMVIGTVIDAATGKRVSGVRVEAWDSDPGADDFLGSADTGADGTFTIVFSEAVFQEWIFDSKADLYFKVFYCGQLVHSTENSVMWNVDADTAVELKIPALPKPPCIERHVYLKIERVPGYSPVKPQDKTVPPVRYGRDCMRGDGHHGGIIPQAEIDARRLDAVVYREYLDSGYLIPKPDKLILADVNEPVYERRVPGTVIYTRPCERLKIHVWNTDDVPHSLHVHGLRYGIDSDGSWPFGTESTHGHRSDTICPGGNWTYTFEVTDEMYGAWPFHDHTHHHHNATDQGLFGGIVVLRPCDKPPRPFNFPSKLLGAIYGDVARLAGVEIPAAGEGPKHGHHAEPHDAYGVRALPKQMHVRRLKGPARQFLKDQLAFLEELAHRHHALLKRPIPTDHVPVFFHVLADPGSRPAFDSGDLEEAIGGVVDGVFEHVFAAAGDFEYFCRHHPEMTGTVQVTPGGPMSVTVNIIGGAPPAFSPPTVTIGVGGTARWENHDALNHHTVTSREGASMPTHCINGRGFIGNSPTIEAPSGQKIRWYVFNLDTSTTWHNFHPHAMRWKFGGESIDIRSMGPAESFVVETEVPPVLLLDDDVAAIQPPAKRPKGAKRYHLKGEFMFHCHVHHHMMNGMIGLVRARQTVWLTDEMAAHLRHDRGLPIDDGSNDCPDVDDHPCHHHGSGHWEEIAGNPEVTFMHAVLLPGTKKVLYWGYTEQNQSRLFDYSTPAGAYAAPANQPAGLPGMNINNSDMWSAEHAVLNTPEGHVLIHGGFSPRTSFTFDPTTLSWAQVASTAQDRFYSTTLIIGDGRSLTLFGSASKSIEAYTHGAGWAAPTAMPVSMNHHQYYPWTYLLPDGRLFIAGPHVPTQRFDWNAPAGVESFPTIGGDRSTGGEKGSSVMCILRPPLYDPEVIIVGGSTPTTQKTAESIHPMAAAPAWSALPDLNVARPEQFTATLLPDGRVFVAGGISGGADGGACEIYDPRTPGAGWQLGPAMKYTRTYHSAFVLLADGSILGGGDPRGPGNLPTPHERFFPDYFEAAHRPVITAAPPTVGYAGTFDIDSPEAADIEEVVLLRAGAVTHGYNMSQRGIELVISGTAAGKVTVQGPPNANLCPPGWYLLFVLNASRVPSEGRWVRVTP